MSGSTFGPYVENALAFTTCWAIVVPFPRTWTHAFSSGLEGARPEKSWYCWIVNPAADANGGNTDADRADAGPVVTALMAATLNRYRVPGVRPDIVVDRDGPRSSFVGVLEP